MLKLLVGIMGCLMSMPLIAQTNPLFVDKIEDAQTLAQEENRQILMVFAGSDWCRPCIQFKKDILESSTFATYAKDNLVVLYLDFPARRKNQLSALQKAHNEDLAEQYNTSGLFPNILLFSPDLDLHSQLEFKNQSPQAFVQTIVALGS